MGKNQQHKAQQRSRHGGDGEDLPDGDTSVDVSFHTPEWHAARVAALTAERKTWEEWKLEQKEKASALAAVEDEEDRQNRSVTKQQAWFIRFSPLLQQAVLTVNSCGNTNVSATWQMYCAAYREYKAQLAADRVAKLSGGTNQADLNVNSGKVSKKSHKHKDKKAHKSDKSSSKKHKEDKHSKKKHKSHDKDHKTKRKHVSDSSDASSTDDDLKAPNKSSGPVKLSDFMKE